MIAFVLLGPHFSSYTNNLKIAVRDVLVLTQYLVPRYKSY